jgi:hypothetical protein
MRQSRAVEDVLKIRLESGGKFMTLVCSGLLSWRNDAKIWGRDMQGCDVDICMNNCLGDSKVHSSWFRQFDVLLGKFEHLIDLSDLPTFHWKILLRSYHRFSKPKHEDMIGKNDHDSHTLGQ